MGYDHKLDFSPIITLTSDNKYIVFGTFEEDTEVDCYINDYKKDRYYTSYLHKADIYLNENFKKYKVGEGCNNNLTDLDLSPMGSQLLYRSFDEYHSENKLTNIITSGNLSALLKLNKLPLEGGIEILATAQDLNFSHYSLKYTKTDSVDNENWIDLIPFNDTPVDNEHILTFRPSNKGNYLLKLSVFDLAGNTKQFEKEIKWNSSSVITSLFTDLKYFSPNGDNKLDLVKIKFTVLEPTELSINIFNKNNNELVRTINKVVTIAGANESYWDGLDNNNDIVVDGEYIIEIEDIKTYVEVDNTVPDISFVFNKITNYKKEYSSTKIFKNRIFSEYKTYVNDKNLKEYRIESGLGNSPREWIILESNNLPLDKDIQYPIITTNRKILRLVAEDKAGNKVVSEHYSSDELLIPLVFNEFNESKLLQTELSGYPFCYPIEQCLELSSTKGEQTVFIAETSFSNIKTAWLEFKKETDTEFELLDEIENPSNYFSFYWNADGFEENVIYTFRTVAVDDYGNQIYSPEFNILYGSFNAECINASKNTMFIEIKESFNVTFNTISFEYKLIGEDSYKYFQNSQIQQPPDNEFNVFFNLPDNLSYKEINSIRIIAHDLLQKQYVSKDIYLSCPDKMPHLSELEKSKLLLKNDNELVELKLQISRKKAENCEEDPESNFRIDGLWQSNKDIWTILIYALPITIVDKEIVIEGDEQFIKQLQGMGKTFSFYYDFGDISEKQYVIIAKEILDDNINLVGISNILIYDKTPPTVLLTQPVNEQILCPIYQKDILDNEIAFITVLGKIEDNFDISDENITSNLYLGLKESNQLIVNLIDPEVIDYLIPNVLNYWNVLGLESGDYTIEIEVTDEGGFKRCKKANFVLDKNIRIDEVIAEPSIISVNEDGYFDETNLTVKLFEGGNLNIIVIDKNYNEIKNIADDINVISGLSEFFWDGKNNDDQTVADGTYNIEIKATDYCGNIDDETVQIIVDNTAPDVLLNIPLGISEKAILNLTGTAADPHFDNYILEYKITSNSDEWIEITNSDKSVVNGNLGFLETFDLTGTIILRLTANDIIANTSSSEIVINLEEPNDFIIDSFALEPNFISPNNNNLNDISTIYYSILKNSLISLRITDENNNIVMTLKTNESTLQGAYSILFNGYNDEIKLLEGSYNVLITAETDELIQEESALLIVDTVFPEITFSSFSNSDYLKNNFEIKGTISDNNLNEYRLELLSDNNIKITDLAFGNENKNEYIFTVLSNLKDGSYSLRATASDHARNSSTLLVPFIFDNTPPKIIVESPINNTLFGGINNNIDIKVEIIETNFIKYEVSFSYDKTAGYIKLYSSNKIPENNLLYSWNVVDVSSGNYFIKITVSDKAGNSTDTIIRTIIDNTKPACLVLNLAHNQIITSPLNIIGSVTDDNFEDYKILIKNINDNIVKEIFRSNEQVNNNQLYYWNNLPMDGKYSFTLEANDKNKNKCEYISNVIVDAAYFPAPENLTAVAHNNSVKLLWKLLNEPIDITGFNVYRNGSKIGQTVLNKTEFYDTVSIQEELKYIVTAFKQNGRESEPSNEVIVKIDNTPPVSAISYPYSELKVRSKVKIFGTAYSTNDFKEYRLYFGMETESENLSIMNRSFTTVSNGVLGEINTNELDEAAKYLIKLESEDFTGNISEDKSVIYADNTPPSPPEGLTYEYYTNVLLTWQPNSEADLLGYLLYSNDNYANVNNSRNMNLEYGSALIYDTQYLNENLIDGVKTYYLKAVDTTGNISDKSNEVYVDVNNFIPKIYFIKPEFERYENDIEILVGSEDEDINNIQMQYAKCVHENNSTTCEEWINLSEPIYSEPFKAVLEVKDLDYGLYKIFAKATDNSGLVNSLDDPVTIEYKNLAPCSPEKIYFKTDNGSVYLSWDEYNNEPDVNLFKIYRNSTAFTELPITALNYTDEQLEDGNYTYALSAVDNAGNDSFGDYERERECNIDNKISVTIYKPVFVYDSGTISRQLMDLKIENIKVKGILKLVHNYSTEYEISVNANKEALIKDFYLSVGDNKFTAQIYTYNIDMKILNSSKVSEEINIIYDPVPSSPENLTAKKEEMNVVLRWDEPTDTDVTAYNIYRDGIKYDQHLAEDEREYHLVDLPNGDYSYYITAVDIYNGESEPSNIVSFKVYDEAMNFPQNLIAVSSDSNISLTWDYNSEGMSLSGFSVFRSITTGGPYTLLVESGSVLETAYSDNTVQEGVIYYYVVTAVNGQGADSEFSNEVSKMVEDITPPDPPIITQPTTFGTPVLVTAPKILVEGSCEPETNVELYKNDFSIKYTKATENGSFSFDNVILSDGENILKVLAIDKTGNKSEPSESIIVNFETNDLADIYISSDSIIIDPVIATPLETVTIGYTIENPTNITVQDLNVIASGSPKAT